MGKQGGDADTFPAWVTLKTSAQMREVINVGGEKRNIGETSDIWTPHSYTYDVSYDPHGKYQIYFSETRHYDEVIRDKILERRIFALFA